MEVNGREIGFRRSVLANCELEKAAPDGDVRRLINENLASSSYATAQEAAAAIIISLNKGHEMQKASADPAYKPHPLTMLEVMSLTEPDFNALFEEAYQVFRNDGKITVEVAEDEKKTEKPVKKAAARKSN